jgi:hypothetical protein
MSEKRGGQHESDATSPRETCAARLRLDCLKPNSDRVHQPRRYADYGVAIALDEIMCLSSKDLSMGYRVMNPGVGMSGQPNPRYRATAVNFRIAYGARALRRRSPNSSPSRGKPGTWRSGAGVLRRAKSWRYA